MLRRKGQQSACQTLAWFAVSPTACAGICKYCEDDVRGLHTQDREKIIRLQATAKEQAQQNLDREGISRYQSVEIEEVSEEPPAQGELHS